MYREFTVNNFRGFRDLSLQDLQRVNLITGKNNVGKTALLEALVIHIGTYNPGLIAAVNAVFRGIGNFHVEFSGGMESPWTSFFHDFDTSEEIIMQGIFDGDPARITKMCEIRDRQELANIGIGIPQDGKDTSINTSSSEPARVLRFSYEEGTETRKYYLVISPQGTELRPLPGNPPLIGTFFGTHGTTALGDDAQRYSNLERADEMSVVLEVIQAVEPRVSDLRLLVSNGQPVIHAKLNGSGNLMPLPQMGGGLNRLMSFILAIGNATGGVVIIDEVENGLHYSVLENVWNGLATAARQFNTQIFATTHSRECAIAAHRAFAESTPYDFGLYRLERNKAGEIRSVGYTQDTLEAAIDMDLEVR